jgi:hypothetical protein
MAELIISYFVLGRETSQMSKKADKTTSFYDVANITLREKKCKLSCSLKVKSHKNTRELNLHELQLQDASAVSLKECHLSY